jgi:hypothetical protein
MAAYENNEDIRWDDLGVTDPTIVNKIKGKSDLEKFMKLAQSSSLYQKNPDILKQGLNFLLKGLLDENSPNEQIMSLNSTDCSTPVATVCMQFYLEYLKSHGEAVPEEMIAKLALSDYLSKNAEKLQINGNESIEKVNGVLNSFFLKDSHQHSYNKLNQLKHDHDQPSNTTYIDFSYNLLTEESAALIAEELVVGNEINQEKFNDIVSKYKKNVLGLESKHSLLSNKEYAYNYLFDKAKNEYEGPAYKLLCSLGGSKEENIEALAQRIFLNENMSNSDIEKSIDALIQNEDNLVHITDNKSEEGNHTISGDAMKAAIDHIKNNMSSHANRKHNILDFMAEYCQGKDTVPKDVAKKIIEVTLQRRSWGQGETASGQALVNYLNSNQGSGLKNALFPDKNNSAVTYHNLRGFCGKSNDALGSKNKSSLYDRYSMHNAIHKDTVNQQLSNPNL